MKLVTRSGLKRIAAIAFGAVLVLLVAYQFSPGGVQARNMRRAKEHIATFAATITADARFKKLNFAVGPVDDGCVTIAGIVRTEEDLRDFKAAWERTAPPVKTRWSVLAVGDKVYEEMPGQPAEPTR